MGKNINWKSFISGVVVGSALFSTVSFAAPAAVKLMVNGKEVVSEVPPQIIDGTTLIPARGLAEALGANVQWDGNSQTVTVQTAPYRQLHDEETGILSLKPPLT
ncbi:copper amine oxidase N-terminal domain-containing protein [Paenibacillus sp. TAB 01]|uniref:copper amine oxidase N-terminal domain-containing protein n=1 Tax=Paenibacillus sp. TAB 01 TaxID=3368988 RepID=UPI003751D14A